MQPPGGGIGGLSHFTDSLRIGLTKNFTGTLRAGCLPKPWKELVHMTKDKNSLFSIGIWIAVASLIIAMPVEASIDLRADPLTNKMPISWDQAYTRTIISPDEAKLREGGNPH